MPDGVIIDMTYWRSRVDAVSAPKEIILAQTWTECDITKEAAAAAGSLKNIHTWMEKKLRRGTPKEAIIVKDDRKGETW